MTVDRGDGRGCPRSPRRIQPPIGAVGLRNPYRELAEVEPGRSVDSPGSGSGRGPRTRRRTATGRDDSRPPPRHVARFPPKSRLTPAIVAYTNSEEGGLMTKPATTVETIATSCIAGRLRLLNRVVTNLYDDALRPFGMKLSQGNVLAVTAKLGVARPAQVCDILELDTSTLSRTVDRMVEQWLARNPARRRRAVPPVPPDRPGPAADGEADPGVGEGAGRGNEAPGRGRAAAARRGHPAGEGGPRQVVSFFADETCIRKYREADHGYLIARSRGRPTGHHRRRPAAATGPGLRGRRRRAGRDRASGPGRPAGRHPEVLPPDQDAPRHRLPHEPGADPQPGSFGGEPGVPHARART